MVFSYDKALNFDGETGPYVQYTYARCNSLLERCGSIDCVADYKGVDNKESADLIRLLDRYPDILKDCARKYEPSILTRYIVDVAKAFNKFYFEHNINNAEDAIKKARLSLVSATKQVILNGLTMLGIKAPLRM